MPKAIHTKGVNQLQRQLISLVDQGIGRNGYSSAQLADLAGISHPYLSQLLSGHRPGTLEVWDLLLRTIYGRIRPQIEVDGIDADPTPVPLPEPTRFTAQPLLPASAKFRR